MRLGGVGIYFYVMLGCVTRLDSVCGLLCMVMVMVLVVVMVGVCVEHDNR